MNLFDLEAQPEDVSFKNYGQKKKPVNKLTVAMAITLLILHTGLLFLGGRTGEGFDA